MMFLRRRACNVWAGVLAAGDAALRYAVRRRRRRPHSHRRHNISRNLTGPQFAMGGIAAAECAVRTVQAAVCAGAQGWRVCSAHGQASRAILLPCAAVVVCCVWTRKAAAGQPRRASWLVEARLVELEAGGRHGPDSCTAGQDRRTGSNVREEARAILWKINALAHRRGLCSFEPVDVARGCEQGNEGSWLLSDLRPVEAQSSRVK